MIRINLLPVEHRRTEKAPVGLFLLVIVGLLFLISAGVGFAMLKRNVDKLQTRLTQAKSTLEQEKKKLDQISDKETEIRKVSERMETIMKISMSKISWSQKLFELCQIVKKHPVWIYSISLKSEGPEKSLDLKCFCQGTDERKVADFRKAILRSRSFFSIFDKIESYKDVTPVKIAVPVKDDRDQENIGFSLSFKLGEINIPAPKQ
jgi:Tfp pilus assembly protein PilN